MRICPKCKRKRRVISILVKVKSKKLWIAKCIECRTSIDIEDDIPNKE